MIIEKDLNDNPRILLVEDNKGDIRLTQEAIKESALDIHLDVVTDGEMALDFLNQRGEFWDIALPHIILLDINLPKKSGIDVLGEVKNNPSLRHIPIIILTTSDASNDISRAYSLHANCYILKPVDFDDFAEVIKLIEQYWFSTVQLAVA